MTNFQNKYAQRDKQITSYSSDTLVHGCDANHHHLFSRIRLVDSGYFCVASYFLYCHCRFEVPSGYFADVFGRKGSLILGVIVGTSGFFLYYLAFGFWGFALAEILLAVSAAFLSGADSAFLYDTLQQYGAVDQHTRHQGRIISATRISEATAALVGGFLATIIALKSIFLVEFFVMALAIPIVFSMKEPIIPPSTERRKSISQILSFTLRENKKLLYLNIFSGVISTVTLVMVWFAQPYWEKLGVPLFYFGVIWAGLNILVAVGAFFAHRLEKFFSFRTLFGFIAILPIILYGLLALGIKHLALAIIPLFWILRGVFQPISLDYINRETDSSIRATVVSISQLFGRATFSVLSPFLGWIADVWSLETAFAASALVFGILSIISFLLLYSRMRLTPKTYGVKV
ncbi:MAG: MFS transporter [bacterium]|nr:MFS transporter [bacterium]